MATITSVGDGYWDVAGTWDSGVPTVDDDVVIAHAVAIRDAAATCKTCTVNSGKVLTFNCTSGPTKLMFKDDAAAAFAVTGAIACTSPTATNKMTIAGGSSANKVLWTGNGTSATYLDIDYAHLEYIRFDWNPVRLKRRAFIDKSCTFNYSLECSADWNYTHVVTVEPHGESLILQIAKDKGLTVNQGAELNILGTATYKVYLQGADSSNKMSGVSLYGKAHADYLIMQNTTACLYIMTRAGDFDHCEFTGALNVLYGAYARNYFKACKFTSAYRVFREGRGGPFIFEDCEIVSVGSESGENYGPSRFEFLGDANVGFTLSRLTSLNYAEVFYIKRLTVTVQDSIGPLEGAFVSLTQDHADDYRDLVTRWTGLTDAGLTDANGQVVLLALHKRAYFYNTPGGWSTVYYSDADNNGPSGTKEKHRLTVAKPGYFVNDENTYYMSQDRSAAISLLTEPVISPVKFGDYSLPHVLDIQEANAQIFIERILPGAEVAYRKRSGATGRRWTVTGYLSTDTRYNDKASMRALTDGTARDFDRGTGEALVSCLMLDPQFDDSVDEFGRLSYSVVFVEYDNP